MLRYKSKVELMKRLNELIRQYKINMYNYHELAILWDSVKFKRKKDGKPFKLLSKALDGAVYDYRSYYDHTKTIIVRFTNKENRFVQDNICNGEIEHELKCFPGFSNDEPVYKMQLGSCTKEDVQVPERILMTIIKSKAAMYKIYEKEYAEKIQSIEKMKNRQ